MPQNIRLNASKTWHSIYMYMYTCTCIRIRICIFKKFIVKTTGVFSRDHWLVWLRREFGCKDAMYIQDEHNQLTM